MKTLKITAPIIPGVNYLRYSEVLYNCHIETAKEVDQELYLDSCRPFMDGMKIAKLIMDELPYIKTYRLIWIRQNLDDDFVSLIMDWYKTKKIGGVPGLNDHAIKLANVMNLFPLDTFEPIIRFLEERRTKYHPFYQNGQIAVDIDFLRGEFSRCLSGT
jgi:hypothetical protein